MSRKLMLQYLLRIEGVNLPELLDDTHQLSIRRGGGLLLLNTPSALFEDLSGELQLTRIATGASIGLFSFPAPSPSHAAAVREQVVEYLAKASLRYDRGEIPVRHATHVVDVVPLRDAHARVDVQHAIAANRWRQFQQPTVALEGLWTVSRLSQPCVFDKIRPGVDERALPGEAAPQPVSRRSWDRFLYGRDARRNFYDKEANSECRTTDNLQDLASSRCHASIPLNLAGKVAVLYLDGNRFGSLAQTVLNRSGIDGLHQFSDAVRNHHRELLRGLLAYLKADPTSFHDDQLRFETLLWGGDEILWVLPAWKGWDVVRWFFEQPHRLAAPQLPQERLSYSAGLVFAHAQAPIQGLTRLAANLAALAKQSLPQPGLEAPHRLAYEVLESYDDVPGELVQHRRRFLPPAANLEDLLLDPESLGKIWPELQQLAAAKDWPRRQLYRLVRQWRRGASGNSRSGDDLDETENRVRGGLRQAGVNPPGLEGCLGPAVWHHLLQMVPYLTGQPPNTAETP